VQFSAQAVHERRPVICQRRTDRQEQEVRAGLLGRAKLCDHRGHVGMKPEHQRRDDRDDEHGHQHARGERRRVGDERPIDHHQCHHLDHRVLDEGQNHRHIFGSAMHQIEADEVLGGRQQHRQAQEEHVLDHAELLARQLHLARQQTSDARRENAPKPEEPHPERPATAFHRQGGGVVAGENPGAQQGVGRGQEHRRREQATPFQAVCLAREARQAPASFIRRDGRAPSGVVDCRLELDLLVVIGGIAIDRGGPARDRIVRMGHRGALVRR